MRVDVVRPRFGCSPLVQRLRKGCLIVLLCRRRWLGAVVSCFHPFVQRSFVHYITLMDPRVVDEDSLGTAAEPAGQPEQKRQRDDGPAACGASSCGASSCSDTKRTCMTIQHAGICCKISVVLCSLSLMPLAVPCFLSLCFQSCSFLVQLQHRHRYCHRPVFLSHALGDRVSLPQGQASAQTRPSQCATTTPRCRRARASCRVPCARRHRL
jgi:hypothetical protein